MSKWIQAIGVFLAGGFVAGCASMSHRFHTCDPADPHCCLSPIREPHYVYPGTQSDLRGLAVPFWTSGDALYDGMTLMFYPFVLIDLPFSFVADTLFLPYDAYKVTLGGKTRYRELKTNGASQTDEAAGAPGDPRLCGSWKSDTELSMRWNRANSRLTGEQDAALRQMCGHMTDTARPDGTGLIVMDAHSLTIGTNTHAVPAWTNAYTYEVVGRTKDAVVVKTTSGLMAGHVGTVHFDGPDTYWLLLNEDEPEKSAREYFRKVAPRNPPPQAAPSRF